MKISLAATLASLLLAGNAFAADGFRIENEAQFVRDYGDQVEQIGPGVYQVIKGDLAGKTIAIGNAGLRFDIATQRARTFTSPRLRTKQQSLVRRLEAIAQRQNALSAGRGTARNAKLGASGGFDCIYWPAGGGSPVFYSGSAQVNATTGLYMSNGGGGFNYYYARASANATGSISKPAGVPTSLSLTGLVHAENIQTSQVVSYNLSGYNSIGGSTGYVYSGPTFGHDLYAFSAVSGTGNCSGYVSISDSFQL